MEFLAGISIIFIILFVLLSCVVYFIPTIVAYCKKRKNMDSILILNLFLGWTMVGWTIALIWAIIDDRKIFQKTNTADDLEKFFDLKEKGIITEEEFETKKKELLS